MEVSPTDARQLLTSRRRTSPNGEGALFELPSWTRWCSESMPLEGTPLDHSWAIIILKCCSCPVCSKIPSKTLR
jgi:hypothetical protein